MTSVRGTSRTQHGRTDPDKNQHKTVVMETVLVVSCCHLLGSLKHCSWGIRDRGPQSRLCLCLRVYSCAYSREPTAFLLLVNFKLVIFDPDQSSAGHTRSSQTWSLEQECACAQVKVYMFQLGRACTVRVKVQIRCTDLLGWFWAAAGLTWAAAAGLRSSAADLREQLSFNMLRKCPKRVELQKESQAGRVQILYEREVSLLSTSFRSLSMRWFLSGFFFFFNSTGQSLDTGTDSAWCLFFLTCPLTIPVSDWTDAPSPCSNPAAPPPTLPPAGVIEWVTQKAPTTHDSTFSMYVETRWGILHPQQSITHR